MKKFDYKKCFIVDVDGKKLANKLDLYAFRKGVDVTFNKNVEEVEEGEKEQEQEKEVEEGEKEQEQEKEVEGGEVGGATDDNNNGSNAPISSSSTSTKKMLTVGDFSNR